MYNFLHGEYNGDINDMEGITMYATGNKKMLNMLILEILQVYSDEEHHLTQQEIIRLLKQNYDMDCDRRSVKNNILYLKELGYEISMEDGYYLVQRQFEDAELRLLIDSVLCSKNMTAKQSQVLIEKLQACGNKYFKPKVTHVHNLADFHHSDNKQLMYVVDALNEAIDQKKKVSFTYNSYGVDKKLHPRRKYKDIVNPFQMVTANGFYYLIGNIDRFDNIAHFRLDKITDIEILDDKVKDIRTVEGMEKGLNLPKHMAEHIYMFSGDSVAVKLKTPLYMMNELIDWFGKDFRVLESTENEVTIRVVCNEKAMFYWALQYGTCAEIVEPLSLRENIKDAIREMQERYRD